LYPFNNNNLDYNLDNNKDNNTIVLKLTSLLEQSETLRYVLDEILIDEFDIIPTNSSPSKTFSGDKDTDIARILTYISSLPNIQASIILSTVLPYTLQLNNKAFSITLGISIYLSIY
jgi:hypothetical protein